MTNISRLFNGSTKLASAVPLKDGAWLQVKPTRQMFASKKEWFDSWSKDNQEITLTDSTGTFQEVPAAPQASSSEPLTDYDRIHLSPALKRAGYVAKKTMRFYGITIGDYLERMKKFREYLKSDFLERFTDLNPYRLPFHKSKIYRKINDIIINNISIVRYRKLPRTASIAVFDTYGYIQKGLPEDKKNITIEEWIHSLAEEVRKHPCYTNIIQYIDNYISTWESSPYKHLNHIHQFGDSELLVKNGDNFEKVYTFIPSLHKEKMLCIGSRIGKTFVECGIEGEPEFWVLNKKGVYVKAV